MIYTPTPPANHSGGPMRKMMSRKDFKSFSLVKKQCQDTGMELKLDHTLYDPTNPALGNISGNIKIELDDQSKTTIENDENELIQYDKDLGIDENKLTTTILTFSDKLAHAAKQASDAGKAYQDR